MRDKTKKDYIPYGEEWEKEINKFPKKDIIKMLADALKNKKESE